MKLSHAMVISTLHAVVAKDETKDALHFESPKWVGGSSVNTFTHGHHGHETDNLYYAEPSSRILELDLFFHEEASSARDTASTKQQDEKLYSSMDSPHPSPFLSHQVETDLFFHEEASSARDTASTKQQDEKLYSSMDSPHPSPFLSHQVETDLFFHEEASRGREPDLFFHEETSKARGSNASKDSLHAPISFSQDVIPQSPSFLQSHVESSFYELPSRSEIPAPSMASRCYCCCCDIISLDTGQPLCENICPCDDELLL